MRQIPFIFLIILVSCNSRSAEKTNENNTSSGSSIQAKSQPQDSLGINIDTLKVNHHNYIQIRKGHKFNCLLSMQGDTIVMPEAYYARAAFIDIDKDGFKDFRVYAFSNTPNQCDNYLFDKANLTFTLIKNCDLDIQKIKGTDFFYDYNRAGCSSLNWESHLSKIENFTLVHYGFMQIQGCDIDIEKSPQIIEIYKFNDTATGVKTIIQKLPYQKHINDFGDEAGFINHYWTKNFKTFEG